MNFIYTDKELDVIGRLSPEIRAGLNTESTINSRTTFTSVALKCFVENKIGDDVEFIKRRVKLLKLV